MFSTTIENESLESKSIFDSADFLKDETIINETS